MVAQISPNPVSLRPQGLPAYAHIPDLRGTPPTSASARIDRVSETAFTLSVDGLAAIALQRLSPAASNANDGISLLQVARSGLAAVKKALARMRDLASEAAAATTMTRRDTLQSQLAEEVARIDDIAGRTNYRGIRIFDPNPANVAGDPSLSALLGRLRGGWLENAEKLIRTYYGLTADRAPLTIDSIGFTDGPYGVAARVSATIPSFGAGKGSSLKLQLDRADFVPVGHPSGGVAPIYSDRIIAHEMAHAVMARTLNYAGLAREALWFLEGTAEFIHGGDERFAHDLEQAGGKVQAIVDGLKEGREATSAYYSASYAAVRFLHAQIKTAGGEGIRDVMAYLAARSGSTLDQAFRDAVAPLGGPVATYASRAAFLADFSAAGAAFITATFDLRNEDTGAIGGFDVDGGPIRSAESVIPDNGTRRGNDVLVGFAERFEPTSVERPTGARSRSNAVAGAVNANALGINALNLLDDPADALRQADGALKYVEAEHTRISSQLARLESSFARLNDVFANLSSVVVPGFGGFTAAQLAALIGSVMQSRPGVALAAQSNLARPVALQVLR